MKIPNLLILAIVLSLNTTLAQQNETSDAMANEENSYLELTKIQVVPIKDTKNGRQYELYLKLPEGYAENDSVLFPVIYYTDALWHVEMLSGSTGSLMGNTILVGISWQKNAKEELVKEHGEHVSRFWDYSVSPSSNAERQEKYQLGQAEDHLYFIRNDVFAYIEEHYRADPGNRTYFGYSLGGLFGAYALMAQPRAFQSYILGSPSLQRDIPLLSELGSDANLRANVFISNGDLEPERQVHIEEFIAMLKDKKDADLSITHEVIEGDHGTAFPMTAVRSMQWLSKINNFSVLEGPYLGQKPPGLKPEVFAPGIVSLKGRTEGTVSFSPDLDEMYFGARKRDGNWSVYFSRLENEKWTDIKKANFTKGKRIAESKPFVSPDGKRIYFEDDDGKIWYVNRYDDSWSDATLLDLPIKDDKVFNLIEAKNGDLYFFNTSKWKQYYAPNKNGEFPEALEVDIEFGFHCFISPSQDYLVVDAQNENRDNKLDLYVYFKKQDGTWTEPFNLGNEVNTDFHDSNPRITPDGKYLFFTQTQEDNTGSIHWVSTEVIHRLRPDDL